MYTVVTIIGIHDLFHTGINNSLNSLIDGVSVDVDSVLVRLNDLSEGTVPPLPLLLLLLLRDTVSLSLSLSLGRHQRN